MTWRDMLLPVPLANSPLNGADTAAYQFGVFSGDSMRVISYVMSAVNKKPKVFYGFDVFTGMPKEHAEEIFQPSWNPDIEPDAFNAVKRSGAPSVEAYVDSMVKRIESDGYGIPIDIQIGLVEDTLPRMEGLMPAIYVDFDMDIYSPTKFAFDHLMKNNLILEGTLIGYDDWGGVPDFDNFTYGEPRAHKEICDEYGLEMRELGRVGNAYPSVSSLWVVTKVR
jgi:hypothetical protein